MFNLKKKKGFTFLEVLISLMILSIVTVSIFAIFTQGLDVWRKAISDMRKYESARAFLDMISAELIGATIEGERIGCPMTFVLGEDSNDLSTLRKFRDEVLGKTPTGQEIIRLYYALSPVIVGAMVEDSEFKEEVKEMIERFLPLIRRKMK